MMPKKVKRRRQLANLTGQPEDLPDGDAEIGWEEYYDYVFPEDSADQQQAKGLKILEQAHKWK